MVCCDKRSTEQAFVCVCVFFSFSRNKFTFDIKHSCWCYQTNHGQSSAFEVTLYVFYALCILRAPHAHSESFLMCLLNFFAAAFLSSLFYLCLSRARPLSLLLPWALFASTTSFLFSLIKMKISSQHCSIKLTVHVKKNWGEGEGEIFSYVFGVSPHFSSVPLSLSRTLLYISA